MAKSYWLRLYTELLNSPKIQRMEPELFKAWVNLLCIAKDHDDAGGLPPLQDIAFLLRVSDEKAESILGKLMRQGLVDNDDGEYAMHDWADHQYDSDTDPTATERKRRQRERYKENRVDCDVTEMSRVTSRTSHENVTRTETETETEQEGEREREAPAEPSPAPASPEAEKPSPGKAKRFTPPTLSEVTAYCQERRNAVDPGRWLAYYEANGWKVGRNPMRDWRAAVRTWEGNGYDRPPGKPAVQDDPEAQARRARVLAVFGPEARAAREAAKAAGGAS